MREKANYRDMLQFLTEKGYPLMLTQKQTAEILNCGKNTVPRIISRGHLKVIDGKIPIGSVASYLCG